MLCLFSIALLFFSMGVQEAQSARRFLAGTAESSVMESVLGETSVVGHKFELSNQVNLGQKVSSRAVAEFELSNQVNLGQKLSIRAVAVTDLGLQLAEHAAKIKNTRKEGTAGRLIHFARKDRVGAVITNMLQARAIAQLYDMDYLGVWPPGRTESKEKDILSLLGLPKPIKKIPKDAVTVKNFAEFQAEIEKNPNATIFFKERNIKAQLRSVPKDKGSLFNLNFRMDLFHKAHLSEPTLWTEKTPLRVAVHIRRGDVLRLNLTKRITPNSWYLALIDKIKEVTPDAEFIIFTSTPFGYADGYKLSDFSNVSNVVVRCDQSISEALEHMAQSDVLVASQSSFAKVAGLLNSGLVISPDSSGYEDVERWILTHGTDEELHGKTFDRSLRKGIARAQRMHGRTGESALTNTL